MKPYLSNPRARLLNVRVTEDQHAELCARAQAAGFQYVGEYLRSVLFAEKPEPTLAEWVQALEARVAAIAEVTDIVRGTAEGVSK